MPLSEKGKFLLDRAVTQIAKDGGKIWGFIVTAGEDGELEPFSSHPDTPEKFVEITASAARVMLEGETKEGSNAIN